MKRRLLSILPLLALSATAAGAAIPASYPRQKVLAEVFHSDDCVPCRFANEYLDNILLPRLSPDSFVTIRYHIEDYRMADFPQRKFYYRVSFWPVLFLDGGMFYGIGDNDPLKLTSSAVRQEAAQPSELRLELSGARPAKPGDSVRVRAVVRGSAKAPSCPLSYFLVLTERGIRPANWTPPYSPSNGELVYNQSVRLMVTGQSGQSFTVAPGDSAVLAHSFALDPGWAADSCEVVAFVQNPATWYVLQADSRMLPALNAPAPVFSPPRISTPGGREIFQVRRGDTLALRISSSDPDPGDRVSLAARYAPDGINFGTALPAGVTLADSLFRFLTGEIQPGNFRFLVIGSDSHGLADSVAFRVEVVPAAPRSCDLSGDGRLNVLDALSLLLRMRRSPQDLSLDWNGDSRLNLADVLGLLRDILRGACPAPGPAAALAADRRQPSLGLEPTVAELDYLERMAGQLALPAEQRELLARALEELRGGLPSGLPQSFALAQNHPNPFNPSTTIEFLVPESAAGVGVLLQVHDLRGRVVRTLVAGSRGPGRHAVAWDGRDDRREELPSGVYFYRLNAGGFTATRKLLLLR